MRISDWSSDVCSSDLGIREVAIVTTPEDQDQFKRLMGDGSQWGMTFEYVAQPSPEGLAQAYILTEDWLAGAPSAMVLGDNIFFGHGLPEMLREADRRTVGGTVFGYHVSDPERYGVVGRSEVHTSELQSLLRISYSVFC